MEAILRKTIKSGNASAVVLPKTWLDKRVKVELIDKTPETILYEVLEIVESSLDLSEIIGVYLVGSYAREEQEESSDIDVIVISEKTDKETIKKGAYEIMIISLDLLEYKLKENLLPVGTMLKEARPLLNNNLLKNIKIEVTRKNVQWYLKTTKERLETIKSSIDLIEKKRPDGKLSDAVAYSLVLRLRTLYMIEGLIKNKKYNKGEFIRLIKEISGSSTAYERYVHVKDNEESKRELALTEGKKLYIYLGEYLKKVEKSVK